MSTRQTVLAVGALLTLGGTAPADDDRVAAKLKELGAFVRRDETKPGEPIVSVEVLGSLDPFLTYYGGFIILCLVACAGMVVSGYLMAPYPPGALPSSARR